MPQIDLNDLTLYYEFHGHGGRPVILLHGSFETSDTFEHIIPHLAKKHNVYCLDMRGHGRSSSESLAWSVPMLARDVFDFMDAFKLGCAHIVGHSMGGDVAMMCGILKPKRCFSIVSIGSAGFPNYVLQKHFSQLDPDFGAVKRRPDFFKRLEEMHRTAHRGDWKTFFRMTVASSIRYSGFQDSDLERLAMPFLLLHGENDPFVLEEEIEHLAGHCKNFSHKCIEKAGHSPHWEAQSVKKTAGILMDFFERAAPSRGQEKKKSPKEGQKKEEYAFFL